MASHQISAPRHLKPLFNGINSDIVLTTINASYIHTSIGLRYLYANLKHLQSHCSILEFTTHLRPADIVEKILEKEAKIVGFGVYIWNTEHTTKVVQLLKIIKPEIIIIIGGPEVSYEYEQQTIYRLCDHLITGAADTAFALLCNDLLSNKNTYKKLVQIQEPAITKLILPYQYYTEEDINNRVIYVEASRGCPFKCEFCLSALDKTSIAFELTTFLQEMDKLYQRGARRFKFVDRTFNLKTETSVKLLEFFLQRLDEELFLHFEIIPDRLPDALKELIMKFPLGSLQFEIGIQSFNPDVQQRISRKQDNLKTIENMNWLAQHSHAHIHADLIFALPGEDLNSFAKGFNQLYALKPHDIQLGILKRLRGTPITRHTESYNLKFDHSAPYSILSTDCIDFYCVQEMVRFARYWEIIANTNNFPKTLKLLLAKQAFENFLVFSNWLYEYSGKTHQISLRKLYDYLYIGLQACFSLPKNTIRDVLLEDYKQAGLKGSPEFIKRL